ncbi:MAG TPA: hypothetical protein ACFYD2_09055 [Candidatus Avalokitesvara rifleensis]|nr:hypothetical protein [Candidatus Brocadiales bacterium]
MVDNEIYFVDINDLKFVVYQIFARDEGVVAFYTFNLVLLQRSHIKRFTV